MLAPSKIVKLQLAIPKTAQLLRRYAEETEGPVKEMYQVHPNITYDKGNGFHCTIYIHFTILTYTVSSYVKGTKMDKGPMFSESNT